MKSAALKRLKKSLPVTQVVIRNENKKNDTEYKDRKDEWVNIKNNYDTHLDKTSEKFSQRMKEELNNKRCIKVI